MQYQYPAAPEFLRLLKRPGLPALRGAGDVVFFSEATVHGAMAWTAEHERPLNPLNSMSSQHGMAWW